MRPHPPSNDIPKLLWLWIMEVVDIVDDDDDDNNPITMTARTEKTPLLSTTTSTSRPWVERYRPRNLNEVSHQSEVVATLQNAVVTGRLPHLLFYGPPGSGKVRTFLLLDYCCCQKTTHHSHCFGYPLDICGISLVSSIVGSI